jgi:hypothetical protein
MSKGRSEDIRRMDILNQVTVEYPTGSLYISFVKIKKKKGDSPRWKNDEDGQKDTLSVSGFLNEGYS